MTAPGPDGWYHEKESAWLYRQVASAETDPRKSDLFLKLAEAAEEQAGQWLRGAPAPSFSPALRARLTARLVRLLGVRAMRPVLAAMKVRGLSIYSGPVSGHAMPTSPSQVGARHRSAVGGSLRAAVFGVNDGLVSNVSLVLGVAGAGASPKVVLTAGAAGLLAGALSMAAGEYISVRSQREMYEHQIGLERDELAEYPAEEAEELALIYHARGVDLEQARTMSRALLTDPRQALDVLAREELGLNPDDLGSPWQAAGASFLTFAVGAAIPLLPFLLHYAGNTAVLASAAVTLATLFAVGLGLSLFTGRSALRSGLRMVLIGGGAGGVSFLVGHLLGVVTG
ncbi:MAG: VIT1/CCC1 transporter family protein [Proteobacteria bacterium]|nr:VIT1/CCC1 transporter family protein [Pseudomonadota bacterium]